MEYSKLAKHSITLTVLPIFAGAYFNYLGVFNPIASQSTLSSFHVFSFWALTIGSINAGILLGLDFWLNLNTRRDELAKTEYLLGLESLINGIKRIVDTKITRFYSKAKSLNPSDDVFSNITQPIEQIEKISDELTRFFREKSGLREKHIRITIIHRNNKTNETIYCFQSQKDARHTDPNVILNNHTSVAAQSLVQGVDEGIFYPSKKVALKAGKYYPSQKDVQKDISGSVYCESVIVDVDDYEDIYTISLSTYEKNICDPNDLREIESVKLILEEFMSRIKLELNLLSIKNWNSSNREVSDNI